MFFCQSVYTWVLGGSKQFPPDYHFFFSVCASVCLCSCVGGGGGGLAWLVYWLQSCSFDPKHFQNCYVGFSKLLCILELFGLKSQNQLDPLSKGYKR